MKASENQLLRVIALFKFFKSGSLVALSLGTFKLLHKDIGSVAEQWIERLGLDPGNHFVFAAMVRVSSLTPAQIKKLGCVAFLYAALFLTEGIGLWLLRPWGEWVTVIITSSLVPVEIYEIVRHFTSIRVAVVVINLAVVAYLVYRIRTKKESSPA